MSVAYCWLAVALPVLFSAVSCSPAREGWTDDGASHEEEQRSEDDEDRSAEEPKSPRDAGSTRPKVDSSPAVSGRPSPLDGASEHPSGRLDADASRSADLLAEPSTLEGTTDYGGGARGEVDESLFRIILDYRFDTRGAMGKAERRALRMAAALWERRVASKFAAVPAGTPLRLPDPQDFALDPENFSVDYPIGDVVVFVGSGKHDGPGGTLAQSAGDFAKIEDSPLARRLLERFAGSKHQPWSAALSFDEAEPLFVDSTLDTEHDLDPERVDFLTVALHELGHALGIGGSKAFQALVKNDTFVGPHAVALYGKPVPLAPDGCHIATSVLYDGRHPLMDPTDGPGRRAHITALDLAILEDLGYEIRSP